MRRRAFIAATALAGAATGLLQPQRPAGAQPATRRVARVAWLGWSGDTSAQPSLALAALREGLAALPDTLINRLARPLAEFNTRRRLPSISGWAEFAQAGNLLSYGPVYSDFHRQMTGHGDKILRGARAADFLVERPTRFQFVANRRAAREMGLALPPSLLVRADEVIG